ncbi:basic helix-loop-helix (bHLH) DNA-bindingsuperfamily protein [Striga asiatica]|uniref:Basic helix-loop-helix (BHLH) DNA-bindingsuperfamily protein n=1 Tax=Striga asiatica TaxID=4170 RepID=A0A5A7PPV5_STRAF|nr:basic helix-loop-helix (bHLH) DNA-bindingsuperfamily protein [Striga asiatica]
MSIELVTDSNDCCGQYCRMGLLPSDADKASLLGEAVRRVRELKKTAAALASSPETTENPTTTSAGATLNKVMFPSETDELKLNRCEGSGLIRASLSCEDRPEMIADMIEALKGAEARAVRAEMSTVGGRSKSVVWVEMAGEADVAVGTLRRALRGVIDKSNPLAASGQGLPRNKRPRYYHF